MTTPQPVNPRSWLIPLVFVVGIAIGYIFCRLTVKTVYVKAAVGDCRTRPDTALVASNVTEQYCHDQCPTCTWTQGTTQ